MPQPNPPISLANLISIFTTQLTVSIHTILAARGIYPASTFIHARAYNYPIMQSRHPGVCAWVGDAVKAVQAELHKGTVARIALVIFEARIESKKKRVAFALPKADPKEKSNNGKAINGAKQSNASGPRADAQEKRKSRSANVGKRKEFRPLERYVWDVSRWPQIPKGDLRTPFSHASEHDHPTNEVQREDEVDESETEEMKQEFRDALRIANADLQEQFRGLLARLSTVSSKLLPLPNPKVCTFTLCIELKEESDPPIGQPQPWIPSQKHSQRRILHPREGDENMGKVEREGRRPLDRGTDLGGVRTTPVRSVDASEMIFEMWIEEATAKFESIERKAPTTPKTGR